MSTNEYKHCIEYATLGKKIVFGTEGMTNAEIRESIGINKHSRFPQLIRLSRCPVCNEWTKFGNRVRQDIDCPAVKMDGEKNDYTKN